MSELNALYIRCDARDCQRAKKADNPNVIFSTFEKKIWKKKHNDRHDDKLFRASWSRTIDWSLTKYPI